MAKIRPAFGAPADAVRYFRDKVNLPTRTWRDLQRGEHAQAFVVAGATKEDLLRDLRGAVDRAIADGETLERFRKRFDEIVARHGWSYNGGRAWRTRVIYDTNLRTAFMAGRYAQMTDPDVLRRHPYWEYRHHTVIDPREEHLAWNHLVLRWDDPWWRVHYPPNGWGCKCDVLPLTERRLRELGKPGPDRAPPGDDDVAPEWRYNVGEAGWGKPLADQIMRAASDAGGDAFDVINAGGAAEAGLPQRLAIDRAGAKIATGAREEIINRAIDGERVYTLNIGGVTHPVYVNAQTLIERLDASAVPYVPMLSELLTAPAETWVAFERHRVTGEVQLRIRALRAVATTRDGTDGVVLVATIRKGMLEALAVVPNGTADLDRWRRGKLFTTGGTP